jgi:hypothetical protein
MTVTASPILVFFIIFFLFAVARRAHSDKKNYTCTTLTLSST